MMRTSGLAGLSLLMAGVTAPAAWAQSRDSQGCPDTPLFTRMPSYHIARCTTAEFDQERISDADGEKTVAGHKTVLCYAPNPGAAAATSAEILRNYANAMKAVGGAVTWESRFHADMRLERGGVKTWALLDALNPSEYCLTIIEEAGMRQVVKADADAWLKDLQTTGHASVYGIYFDTGLAVVKPESQPTLAEMAKLMTLNPSLSAYIVGHTDSTGSYEANLRLSRDRAAAVVQALVSRYRVPASRLHAAGVGPLSPTASNRTEAGRAKNRRVELVEQ